MLNAADITARLARSLLLARHQRGISQDKLADLLTARGLHVRGNEIRRWEHGKHRISERSLLVIVSVLGHDLAWWYDDHDAELAEHDLNHAAVA